MKLAPKVICSGCAACHDVCPRNAILMVADEEGFLYPQIDGSKCARCGLCEKVCPSLNRDLPRTPLAVYAAKAKDDELRLKSSSGGVFSLLARQVLARGGKVFGAAFDKVDWSVCQVGVADEDGLSELRGSKYVQSRTTGIYRKVKETLEKGVPVLFSGTPCQIAALKSYLALTTNHKPPTTNLFLVDVVCHAVPSPMVWQKYLDEREAALAGGRGSAPTEGRNIRRIAFRHKNCGWKRYSLSLRFANDKEYRCDLCTDPFLRGFLNELYNRPSCHNCQCRELRSGSDLTLADYWRVHEKFLEMDDDRGTSLVLVNTEAGAALVDEISSQFTAVESDFHDAIRVNPSIVRSGVPNRKRGKFFDKMDRRSFDSLVVGLLQRPLWRRIASRIKRMVVRR